MQLLGKLHSFLIYAIIREEGSIMIELKNIEKSYIKKGKKIEVLKNVNYKFNSNTFYYINGKSGTGKSTIIQILGLLLNVDEGTVLLKGKDISKLNENERATIRNQMIGFIFQSYYLNPFMKADENVMLPTFTDKTMTQEERIKKAHKLLKHVGLEDRTKHYPKELSGGEQQRVAIARAIINNPDIILADEPTGSLDPENEEEILKWLKNLRDLGKCVIVVSHSKTPEKYADVILRVENHNIVEVKNEKLI